jgi:plastocyanin
VLTLHYPTTWEGKKMKKIVAELLCIIILINIIFMNAYAEDGLSQIIIFKDSDFKEVMKQNGIDVNGDGEISVGEAKAQTKINYRGRINDISGIEYFTNLETFILWGYNDHPGITDISPLSNLTHLSVLELNGNSVESLTPLKNLTNLRKLSLERNKVNNIDLVNLSGLANLTHLNLCRTDISNISSLSGLTNLTHLDLESNNVTDITPIHTLTNLTELHLGWNGISDISGIKRLFNLKTLYLDNNKITNIEDLSDLQNLEFLHLSGNSIGSIERLLNLQNISSLNLAYNNIKDISPLSGLTNLEYLDLGYNPLYNSYTLGAIHKEELDFIVAGKLYEVWSIEDPIITGFDSAREQFRTGDEYSFKGIVKGDKGNLENVKVEIETTGLDITPIKHFETTTSSVVYFELKDVPAIEFGKDPITEAGEYELNVYARNEGMDNDVLLGTKVVVYDDSPFVMGDLSIYTIPENSNYTIGDDIWIEWVKEFDDPNEYYDLELKNITTQEIIHTEEGITTSGTKIDGSVITGAGNYEIKVTAKADGWTPSEATITFTIKEPGVLPGHGIPTNVIATKSGNIITVTWDEVDSSTGYDVMINDVIYSTNEIPYIYTINQPVEEYRYAVRAKNANGIGEFSAVGIISDQIKMEESSPKNNQTNTPITSDGLVLHFNKDVKFDGTVVINEYINKELSNSESIDMYHDNDRNVHIPFKRKYGAKYVVDMQQLEIISSIDNKNFFKQKGEAYSIAFETIEAPADLSCDSKELLELCKLYDESDNVLLSIDFSDVEKYKDIFGLALDEELRYTIYYGSVTSNSIFQDETVLERNKYADVGKMYLEEKFWYNGTYIIRLSAGMFKKSYDLTVKVDNKKDTINYGHINFSDDEYKTVIIPYEEIIKKQPSKSLLRQLDDMEHCIETYSVLDWQADHWGKYDEFRALMPNGIFEEYLDAKLKVEIENITTQSIYKIRKLSEAQMYEVYKAMISPTMAGQVISLSESAYDMYKNYGTPEYNSKLLKDEIKKGIKKSSELLIEEGSKELADKLFKTFEITWKVIPKGIQSYEKHIEANRQQNMLDKYKKYKQVFEAQVELMRTNPFDKYGMVKENECLAISYHYLKILSCEDTDIREPKVISVNDIGNLYNYRDTLIPVNKDIDNINEIDKRSVFKYYPETYLYDYITERNILSIGCPIIVNVYNGDELIVTMDSRVESFVENEYGTFSVIIENDDSKFDIIPYKNGLKLEIKGVADGTMDIRNFEVIPGGGLKTSQAIDDIVIKENSRIVIQKIETTDKVEVDLNGDGKIDDSYDVLKYSEPRSLDIIQSDTELPKGCYYQLDTVLNSNGDFWDGEITWQSSDYSVIDVNEDGLLHSLSEGTAIITAKIGDKLVDSCNVTVIEESNQIPTIDIQKFDQSPTNEDLTVTAYITNGIKSEITHTFEENGQYDFIAENELGYISIRTVVVNNIDKVAPQITIKDYITETTKGPIIVYAEVNEGTLNTNNHTFTRNGSYTFVATDEAGNKSQSIVTINNIIVDTSTQSSTGYGSASSTKDKSLLAEVTIKDKLAIINPKVIDGNIDVWFYVRTLENTDTLSIDCDKVKMSFPVEAFGGFDKIELKINTDVNLDINQKNIVGDREVYEFILLDKQTNKSIKLVGLSEKVKISIPYNLKEGENPKFVTVFYLDNNNEIVNMKGIFDDGYVTFETNHFSKYYIDENKITFLDTTNMEVLALASKEIIKGKGGAIFDPNGYLTRAELVALIVRALELDSRHDLNTFDDVSKDDWFYEEVMIAREHNIVEGIGNNLFAPNDLISYQDAIVIISRIMNDYKNEKRSGESLHYKGTSEYAFEYINHLVKLEFIPETFNNGQNPITREEMAGLIYDMFFYK